MRELTVLQMLRPLVAAAVLLCAVVQVSAQDRPRIVAVTYPLQYFAERLVGDTADVIFPVPADVDPSFWRPGIADISMIQSADLILLNGAGFAAWIDRVSLPRARVVNTSAAIEDQFIVTESITHSHGDGGAHSHEGLASYTWLDPTLAAAQAEAIASALVTRDLAPAEQVETRLAALTAELESLDAEVRAALVAAQGVAMVATHPRYQYFARRYGLSIAALEWEAGAMPTADELSALETLAAETQAGVLIWEAEPPGAAVDAAQALGLYSVTFPPLAHAVPDVAFDAAFRRAVAAVAEAARKTADD